MLNTTCSTPRGPHHCGQHDDRRRSRAQRVNGRRPRGSCLSEGDHSTSEDHRTRLTTTAQQPQPDFSSVHTERSRRTARTRLPGSALTVGRSLDRRHAGGTAHRAGPRHARTLVGSLARQHPARHRADSPTSTRPTATAAAPSTPARSVYNHAPNQQPPDQPSTYLHFRKTFRIPGPKVPWFRRSESSSTATHRVSRCQDRGAPLGSWSTGRCQSGAQHSTTQPRTRLPRRDHRRPGAGSVGCGLHLRRR